MPRKFVCVGFHSSQGDGAAVMASCYENRLQVQVETPFGQINACGEEGTAK